MKKKTPLKVTVLRIKTRKGKEHNADSVLEATAAPAAGAEAAITL